MWDMSCTSVPLNGRVQGHFEAFFEGASSSTWGTFILSSAPMTCRNWGQPKSKGLNFHSDF